jgi:hypothetical protein
MRLRISRLSMLAGLASAATLIGGVRSAAAAAGGNNAMTGISIVSGSIAPVGDPFYDYQFNIVLGVGDTLSSGGYITVYDFPTGTGSLTSQPGNWTEMTQNVGETPGGATITDNPSLENVTWTYVGSTPITNTGSTLLSLGTFSIGPTPDVTSPGPPITIEYASALTSGGTAAGQGVITIYSVPEPPSFVLLVCAGGIMPLVVLLQRRRGNSSRLAQAH